MSDPRTQSSQISSSQGLNDGHPALSKGSTFSDSFFSSPVSLIQSPQDKRVVLGSDKPAENLATSLSFSSKPSSFSSAAYGNESSGPPKNNIDCTFKEKREPFDSSFGSQKQDSPIKTSPVYERIKALEAIAAKQNDFNRNDGGFPQFKERHYEKSPTESHGISTCLSFQKRTMSTEQDSPESPFEVLGETKCGNEFEDTVNWMKVHLPPAPDFNIVDPDLDVEKVSPLQESPPKELKANNADAAEFPETFAGVPDQFMDSPIKVAENDDDDKQSKQDSVEEESEFDLSFLPTAYMWDKQEKLKDTQSCHVVPENQELPASPVPPADFECPSPSASKQIDTGSVQHSCIVKGNLEPTEILEVDSSVESDDTVIEEVGPNLESGPHKEMKTMPEKHQVPIINVIETEEQVLSDEEEEQLEVGIEDDTNNYPVIQGEGQESIEQRNECSEVSELVSVENQLKDIETETTPSYTAYQTNSDAEQFSTHMTIEDDHESDIFIQSSDSGGLNLDLDFEVQSPVSQNECEPEIPVSQNVSYEPLQELSFNKELEKPAEKLSDLPLENIYPSDDPSDVETYLDHYASEELALTDQLNSEYFKDSKEEKAAILKSICHTENQNIGTLAQESFEVPNEQDLSCEAVPVPFTSDTLAGIQDNIESILTQNKMPSVDFEDQSSAKETKSLTSQEQELPFQSIGQQFPVQENQPPLFSSYHNEQCGKINEVISDAVRSDISKETVITHSKPGITVPNVLDRQDSPEAISDTENVEPECSVTTATDSFVEFMRECLKSRQDEEFDGLSPEHVPEDQNPKSDAPAPTQSSPAMIMDFEQESLTICALKKLGSSQDQDDENLPTVKKVPKSSKVPLPVANPEPSITSSSTPQTLPNEDQPDVLLLKEVEAIDIWVAEAYHLAEHVLTAILTHLTVSDLVHWRDPMKSGVVFGVSLLLLLSLAAFSVISVVSYLLLALLCVTISFRIYKSVIQAVQKSSEGHPFKALMEKDVTVPPETFHKQVDLCLSHVNRALKQMSRLFLVQDLVDSLKLAVVMWLLTYVGAVFNGITILILADILLFSVPPIYEKYKTQIDHYVGIARTQVNTTIAKLQEKLPKGMKCCKTE